MGDLLPLFRPASEVDIDILLARLTAARAGYLDELAAANIPADIDILLTSVVPRATDEQGSFNWDTSAYTTVEQDISALFTTPLTGTTRRKYTLFLDLTGPEGDAAAWTTCTVKVKVEVDGANPRTVDKKTIAKTDVAAGEEPGINIDIPAVAKDVQVTMQFDVALAVDKTIYYCIVTEALE